MMQLHITATSCSEISGGSQQPVAAASVATGVRELVAASGQHEAAACCSRSYSSTLQLRGRVVAACSSGTRQLFI